MADAAGGLPADALRAGCAAYHPKAAARGAKNRAAGPTMEAANFDKIARGVLGPLLAPLGFDFRCGAFLRDLDTRVRHLVMLDYDGRRKRYTVLLGLHSSVLDLTASEEPGAYVTKRANQRPLPAHDVASATTSLETTRVLMEKFGLSWLDRCSTLAQLAVLMPDQYDLMKGRLFLEAGDRQAARHWLAHYRARLDTMQGGPEIGAAIRETESLLTKC